MHRLQKNIYIYVIDKISSLPPTRIAAINSSMVSSNHQKAGTMVSPCQPSAWMITWESWGLYLLVLNVGNGSEWGKEIVISSFYGSFPSVPY